MLVSLLVISFFTSVFTCGRLLPLEWPLMADECIHVCCKTLWCPPARHINKLWSNLVWFGPFQWINFGKVWIWVELWDHYLHRLIVRVTKARVTITVAPSLVQEDPRIGVMMSEISVTHQGSDEVSKREVSCNRLTHLTHSTRMSRYGTELSHWKSKPKDDIWLCSWENIGCPL